MCKINFIEVMTGMQYDLCIAGSFQKQIYLNFENIMRVNSSGKRQVLVIILLHFVKANYKISLL